MQFVIFLGSFGHPGEHWFPLVKKSLEALGHKVLVPKFPCEDWDEMTKMGKDLFLPIKAYNLGWVYLIKSIKICRKMME